MSNCACGLLTYHVIRLETRLPLGWTLNNESVLYLARQPLIAADSRSASACVTCLRGAKSPMNRRGLIPHGRSHTVPLFQPLCVATETRMPVSHGIFMQRHLHNLMDIAAFLHFITAKRRRYCMWQRRPSGTEQLTCMILLRDSR